MPLRPLTSTFLLGLCLAALPLAAQVAGMDIQSSNSADAKILHLQKDKRWVELADHFEGLTPKDRDRNLATYLSALQKADRWQRLAEVCPPLMARFEKEPTAPPSLARQFLAVALSRLGRHAEAVEVQLEIGRRGDPRGYENALGEAWNTKDYMLLLQTAEHVLARRPTLHQASALKGEALAKLGRVTEAEPYLTEATARLPKRATSWSDLAYCQQERGALDEALASATQALTLDPKLIEARYNRARTLMALKRYPEAREDLATGLTLDPAPETKTNLETILGQVDRYLEGQNRKAEREARKAAEAAARKGRKR